MTRFAPVLALFGVVFASPAIATTYAVDEPYGSETLVGTITTDGTFGVLTASNIVDWSLTLPAPLTLTPANSAVTLTGNHLTATPTALLFDFTSVFPALYTLSFDSTGGEVQGHVQYSTNGGFFYIGTCDVGTTCFAAAPEPRSGVGVIAGAAASTTPLPGAVPLFASGLGAAGLLVRRAKRKRTAPAA